MKRDLYRVSSLLKYFYCITFLILLMDRMDNVPIVVFSVLRKIKYLYLFFNAFYFLATCDKRGIKKKTVPALIVLILLLLHTLLWGMVFVNETVKTETNIHMRELLILIVFISETAYLYYSSGTVLEFAKHTYGVYLLALLWAGLTHFSDFVNPIKFIYVFGGSHTYRVAFGFGHANYVGSICCCALLCSIYLIDHMRKHLSVNVFLKNKRLWMIILADVYIGEMLFSTASRTAILAFLIAIVMYIIYNANNLLPSIGSAKPREIIILGSCLAIILLFLTGTFSKLLTETNRDNLISTNMQILNDYFNRRTGMGYINYSGFSDGVWLFGYETANVDSYYAYIFFATGYLGTFLIMLALFITGLYVCKEGRRRNNIVGSMIFVAFILIGITQASLISYDHLMSISFWVLFFMEMSGCTKDTLI